MDEEDEFYKEHFNKKYSECKCLSGDTISESLFNSEHEDVTGRKEFILSTVTRTENYLRERRIPELIRFLFAKVIAHSPDKPVAFLEKLLDDCMLFRAGHGLPPVMYENRHLQAVINSFDPGRRGWLSAGQIRRLYLTLGLGYPEITEERLPLNIILEKVISAQESDLAHLLAAGLITSDKSPDHENVCK